MPSVGNKLLQLDGLLGTADLSEWEQKFVESCLRQSDGGKHTLNLTGNQVEKIDEVWQKHFSG